MTRYIQRSWELSCSLSVNHTAYWVRLRAIRWHLVMTKRVLSCHLQLSPLSLWAVFPFCHHLSAPTGYNCRPKSLIFNPHRSNRLCLSIFPPWPSLPPSLSRCSLVPSPVLFSGVFCDYISFGGRKRGRSSARSEALVGVYIVKDVPSKCRWKYLSVIQFHPVQYT